MSVRLGAAAPFRRIEKLKREHNVETFDCGVEALNRYLIRYALPNQQAGSSQTYVAVIDDVIVGYYSLAVGNVDYQGAPQRIVKGLARHPVPIMLLARMAAMTFTSEHRLGHYFPTRRIC